MKIDEVAVGVRVRCIRPFAGVPVHTEGVIDEADADCCVVAWDHPERRLPHGYAKYDGKPAIATGIRRDLFDVYELKWLNVVKR